MSAYSKNTQNTQNPPSITNILSFPYRLDTFQEESILALQNQHNVLVTAHTSAGKSTIAEYAIAHGLSLNKRVIYTSPIKALSNQKFSDFKKKYGNQVGIMTGDIKVRPDASVMVATTEIINNLLYTQMNYFENVYAIVLDEVHYIRDPERGHVWEEVIALAPKHVLLVMLSASIPGAERFSSWVTTIKNVPCELISTKTRPVPLKHHVYWDGLFEQIMNNTGTIFESSYRFVHTTWKKDDMKPVRDKTSVSQRLNSFVDFLEKKEYLPGLFFMFSRKQCERLAKLIQRSYITGKEATESLNLFEYFVKKYLGESGMQLAQVWMIRSLLQKGICVHHSGLLPVLKEIVETLFDKGWIRVMFVTETFSVGINMPTKCVVFGELTKFDGKERRVLNPEEYCQMSGRAGRRGKDTEGIVMYFPVNSAMIPYHQLHDMLSGQHGRIKSLFEMDPVLLLRCIVNEISPYHVLKNTLAYYELESYMKGLDYQHRHIQEKLLTYVGISTEDREVYEQFEKIRNECEKCRKANTKKKLLSKVTAYQTEHGDAIMRLEGFRELERKDVKNRKDFEDASQDFKNTLSWYVRVLHETGFLHFETHKLADAYTDFIQEKRMDLPRTCVSLKGHIASLFHETDAFLASEIVTYVMSRKDMCEDSQEDSREDSREDIREDMWSFLVGMLIGENMFRDADIGIQAALKISVEKDETRSSISKYLNWIVEKYEELAGENRLHNHTFELCPLFGCFTLLWIQRDWHFETICSLLSLEMYEGNFVRSMLKVSNVLEEFEKAFEVCHMYEISIVLRCIQTRIMKGIVQTDSLYVDT